VRAGSILPQQPVIQYVGETPQGPLELRVYPGPHCSGDLYMDDGNTMAYQHGEFLRMHFTCSVTPNFIQIDLSAAEGNYHPWFADFQITVYGLTGKPANVELDGKTLSGWRQQGNHIAVSRIPWSGSAHTLRLATAAGGKK